jgi:hypothetical protein
MRFMVYQTVPFSGTTHVILRGGDAPEDQIAIQAGDGETAIAAPASWSGSTAPGNVYDSSTGEAWFIAAPPPPPPEPSLQDNLDFYLPRIQQALRDSEWALLSDAPLTAPQITEMVDHRAYLRGLPATITSGLVSYDLTPPYTEF